MQVAQNNLRQDIELVSQKVQERLGVYVDFVPYNDNAFYPEEDEIIICNRQNLKSRLHTLLHEVGHACLRNERLLIDKRRPRGTVATLLEEVLAWDRGKEFAMDLGISLDVTTYEKHKVKHLRTWFRWATDE
jgi:antirestriction protein ArdC